MALGTAVLAGVMAPAGATPAGPGEYPGVRNILPPGQSGSINAAEAAQVAAGDPQGRVAVDGQNAPANFADQLEMYDALNHADLGGLTDGQLSAFYKDAPLTLSNRDAVRTDRPKFGVIIRWDSFAVPYIEGKTREDAAFGSGYAGTKDRMFLMDLLRHVGAARAAEFLGPDEANVAMDQEQLRAAFYTPEEAAAQIDQAAERFGAEGRRLVAALDAYIAGINAAQQELCPAVVTGPECPAEYAALQKKPEPWTRADVVYVASLVGGIFGKGGGAEFANARWLQQLEARFGADEAKRIFDDLALADDPEAPTTASTPAPYGSGPVDPTLPGVALPDLDGPTAPGTGADAGNGGLPDPGLGSLQGRFGTQDRATVVQGPFGPIDLGGVPDMMSNAALVAGDRTVDGHPRVVFGPQTGYFTPQLLTEQAVVAPGIRARGVSFAGTSLVVQLGRGVDYAWSATSAGSDLVDTVVERLCDLAGGEATVESEGYLVGNECRPMDKDVHEETALPNAAAPGLPQTYRFLVLRTEHGIVQVRTTVDGRPVAVVLERSTYGRELDSALGFERLGNPDYVQDAATFRDAAAAIDYTFNWFYVDDRDIAYYSSGRLPVRADGVDGHLPRWGDAAYDWQGWLAVDDHPQQANPPSGFLVSWNNKQAPGFSAADDQWGYGPVHRSQAISDRLADLAATGGVTTTDVVAAVQDAATVDSRAFYTLPSLLDVVGDDPELADAVSLLRGWQQRGAHRLDQDRDGAYEEQAAIALFDAWWGAADEQGVAQDLLRGTLGDLVGELPQRVDDHPRQGLGSSWNGVAWYGYVLKDLDVVRGIDPGAWSRAYCGGGDLATCQADLRTSLRAAVDGVLAEQGVSSVDQLTYDKHLDDIRATTAGLVASRPIDWQNRPTFQQVVDYSSHRPR
ncbi:penicillin acylase family protein [Blastococcus sp. CT_GayMR16]|uniref:penicillin acylase family protein n=1 Tax=Blastococcus sp. CT_GayMR16 TaxID=2559607 RepID=UPI001430AC11|nr:penicillin acylase family protein [Blastococcus sp. CT_GayMR16]